MKHLNILAIPDTQAKPGVDLSYMRHIGEYIVDKRPDVIVHLGDAFDLPSLSSYDKGTAKFEGRRLKKDIEYGKKSLQYLLQPLKDLQRGQKFHRKKVYKPRLVFCVGNHEERLMRIPSQQPEFQDFITYELLGLNDMWEVHDFLEVVNIGGINFTHYLANPFTGRPYGGTALNQLKQVGASFFVGHKQTLDVAIKPTLEGRMQLGIICGAAYPHHEDYKGPQGNHHFRGIVMLHRVCDGYGDPCFVSLDYLNEKYGG